MTVAVEPSSPRVVTVSSVGMFMKVRIISRAKPPTTAPLARPPSAPRVALIPVANMISAAPKPNAARNEPITGAEKTPPPASTSKAPKIPSRISPRTKDRITIASPMAPITMNAVIAFPPTTRSTICAL